MVWIEKGMRYFFSYGVVLLLLAILGIGAGVATFIESAYDTQSAKIAVYDAAWYETIMVLSCLCMIGLMYKTRMWRRKGAFLIHAAFVVILIGAGLTRYFGYEGVMHVREGKSENEMLTVTSYLHVETPKASFEYPLALT
ncbi:MAG: NAD(FAD)-utilizing dehydrogenase, partial [Epsilonproteobacteria bacterium]|nr:NAD(FAD)-utilizing dehydrogenase [Campylobacterota bacterium]